MPPYSWHCWEQFSFNQSHLKLVSICMLAIASNSHNRMCEFERPLQQLCSLPAQPQLNLRLVDLLASSGARNASMLASAPLHFEFVNFCQAYMHTPALTQYAYAMLACICLCCLDWTLIGLSCPPSLSAWAPGFTSNTCAALHACMTCMTGHSSLCLALLQPLMLLSSGSEASFWQCHLRQLR